MDIEKQYNLIGEKYISIKKKLKNGTEESRVKKFIMSSVDFRGKNILDLGCGSGDEIDFFKKAGAKGVYGIDSSELMIEKAKQIVKSPKRLFVANILNLPFPNNKFDIIVANLLLYYISDLDSAWKEIARVLKKGGILIFIIPHPFSEIFLKKSKNYSKKEQISFNAHQKFILKFPSHTLSEYLSESFLQLFEINKIWELTKQKEWTMGINAPIILGIKSKKNSGHS